MQQKNMDYHLIFIIQMTENIIKPNRFMKNIKLTKYTLKNFI